MSNVFDRQKKMACGDQITLRALSKEWAPWNYQVKRVIPDGMNYGRPGEPTCISQANFIHLSQALECFDRQLH